MKNEKLLNAIGKIDDNLVQGAAPEEKSSGSKAWLRWTVAAASVAIVLLVAVSLLFNNQEPVELEALPMLSITGYQDGMGYGGLMAYDISEIVNDNPWTPDAEISTLPVYKNVRLYSSDNQITESDVEDLENLLITIAERLGLNIDRSDIIRNIPEYTTEPIAQGYFNDGSVSAEADGVRISVDLKMNVSVTGLKDEEECLKLLPMENPTTNTHGGSYNYDGERSELGSYLYDASGDLTEQIINFNFYKLSFEALSEEDALVLGWSGWGAYLTLPDLSEKVGDYPIVSIEEATELLMDGNYITTTESQIPGEEYIAKVELIYRTGLSMEEYYMPYYLFYVEIPDDARDNGLKSYSTYYVPAVEQQYISNMPLWDGSYN